MNAIHIFKMNYKNLYASFLKKFLNPQKKIKVVFDCSNGAAGPIIKKFLIPNSKFQIRLINEIPNGNFPAHKPNPLERGALSQIKKEVKKRKADIGVIFDSDADRAFFIDDRGRFVDPDVIARLLIWRLKPKKIIIDERTGRLVKELATDNQRIISKSGHYFFKKLMRKTEADFGAERSGHYYFKNFFYSDSGILTAIEVINAVSKLPYSLADFSDLLPRYYRSGEINIKMNQKSRIKNYGNLLREVEKKYKNLAAKISRLDGLTMKFNDWRFNLRLSENEPLLRLNIEALNEKVLKKARFEFLNFLSPRR